MVVHRRAKPTPPIHSHQYSFHTTLSDRPGEVTVYLYVPKDYEQRRSDKKYPLLVNFHGGGFVVGCGTDDCRWFATVLEMTDAIVASVDYRLAPEFPFPTAVDDGADAVLWLVSQAEELGIDLDRGIVLSGFSAGANLAFTIPLKLDSLRQHSLNPQTLWASTRIPFLSYVKPISSALYPGIRLPITQYQGRNVMQRIRYPHLACRR